MIALPVMAATTTRMEGADISLLEPEWENLFSYPGNEPSTSFEWTGALLRHHLVAEDRAFLIRLTRGPETMALVPLVARVMRVFGRNVLVLFPVTDLYNTHGDILSRPMDVATVCTLVSALMELPVGWDVFRMSNVLEEHALVRHFKSAAPRRPLAGLLRDNYPSYFIELPSSYGLYLRNRSSKFRNHLKRTERRIEAMAGVAVKVFTSASDAENAYEMLLQIERTSWKHGHGTAITAVARQVGFYRDLIRGAAAHGRLHLQILMAGDRPVAYNLGYLHDGGYFYLKTSYVESWKALGAATYLRARLIKTLIEQGLRFMDFPAQPYEWERQWTESVRWHKTLSLYRPTFAGIALALHDRIKHGHAGRRAIRYVDPRADRNL